MTAEKKSPHPFEISNLPCLPDGLLVTLCREFVCLVIENKLIVLIANSQPLSARSLLLSILPGSKFSEIPDAKLSEFFRAVLQQIIEKELTVLTDGGKLHTIKSLLTALLFGLDRRTQTLAYRKPLST